jgi:hypothetical protein
VTAVEANVGKAGGEPNEEELLSLFLTAALANSVT